MFPNFKVIINKVNFDLKIKKIKLLKPACKVNSNYDYLTV